MPTYTVSLMRTTTHTAETTVRAKTEDEADKIARELVTALDGARPIPDAAESIAEWDLEDETHEVTDVSMTDEADGEDGDEDEELDDDEA